MSLTESTSCKKYQALIRWRICIKQAPNHIDRLSELSVNRVNTLTYALDLGVITHDFIGSYIAFGILKKYSKKPSQIETKFEIPFIYLTNRNYWQTESNMPFCFTMLVAK